MRQEVTQREMGLSSPQEQAVRATRLLYLKVRKRRESGYTDSKRDTERGVCVCVRMCVCRCRRKGKLVMLTAREREREFVYVHAFEHVCRVCHLCYIFYFAIWMIMRPFGWQMLSSQYSRPWPILSSLCLQQQLWMLLPTRMLVRTWLLAQRSVILAQIG